MRQEVSVQVVERVGLQENPVDDQEQQRQEVLFPIGVLEELFILLVQKCPVVDRDEPLGHEVYLKYYKVPLPALKA